MKVIENYNGKELVYNDDGTITISKNYYQELIESQVMLDCLENWGVDCWSGYSDAYDDYLIAIRDEEYEDDE